MESIFYKILIRNNLTKEERLCDMGKCKWDESTVWWLTEGNYGCDCNRSLEFKRSAEVEKNIDDHHEECSTGRFSIVKAYLSNGEEVEIDE